MYVFSGLEFLGFDLEVLKWTQLPIWEPYFLDKTRFPQKNFMLQQYGYNFGSAMRNCWQLIKLYVVIGGINLLFYPTFKGYVEDSENRVVRWIFRRLINFLHFNVYVRVALLASLFVFIHSFLEAFSKKVETFSYVISWFMIIAMFAFFLVGPIWWLVFRKNK